MFSIPQKEAMQADPKPLEGVRLAPEENCQLVLCRDRHGRYWLKVVRPNGQIVWLAEW